MYTISHAAYTKGRLQRASSRSFPLSPSLKKSLICPQLSKAPLPVGRPPEKKRSKSTPCSKCLLQAQKNIPSKNLSPLVSSPNSPLKLTCLSPKLENPLKISTKNSHQKSYHPSKIRRINIKAWTRVKTEGRTNRWACSSWMYRTSYQVIFMGSKQVGWGRKLN